MSAADNTMLFMHQSRDRLITRKGMLHGAANISAAFSYVVLGDVVLQTLNICVDVCQQFDLYSWDEKIGLNTMFLDFLSIFMMILFAADVFFPMPILPLKCSLFCIMKSVHSCNYVRR